jgi:hypothetical protein
MDKLGAGSGPRLRANTDSKTVVSKETCDFYYEGAGKNTEAPVIVKEYASPFSHPG